MGELGEVDRQLRAIFHNEERLGYTDRTVIGGLTAYAARSLDALLASSDGDEPLGNDARTLLSELRGMLSAYSDASAAQRRLIRERVDERLSRLRLAQGEADVLPEDLSVEMLKNVGRVRANQLRRLGIEELGDLLRCLPSRYQDWRRPTPITGLREGEEQLVVAVILQSRQIRARTGLEILESVVRDESGAVLYAIWFNQDYRSPEMTPGRRIALLGTPKVRYGRWRMENPDYRFPTTAGEPDAGGIEPVYPLTKGITQSRMQGWIGEAVRRLIPSLREWMPAEVVGRYHLMPPQEAWRYVHHPPDFERLAEARRRLAFEELFLMQVALGLMHHEARHGRPGIAHTHEASLVDALLTHLPFALTAEQRRVWSEIAHDMEQPAAMNRLLQGDVGSGKTIVAALALLKTISSGHQGALMAPTEILAEQHFLRLQHLLAPLGVQVVLLVGGMSAGERAQTLARIRWEQTNVVVGTHALVQPDVEFGSLGLVVIDEQHRFGVGQRGELQAKGPRPDVLVMTATPIPRTLAMTLYGDLDVSLIRELPPGRQPVQTRLLPIEETDLAWKQMEATVMAGHQAFIVCARIGDEMADEEADDTSVTSDNGTSVTSDDGLVRSARDVAAELQVRCPNFRIGLLHGRQTATEKMAMMSAFAAGRVDVLVSTTVVEVGVDVPNAALMVVMDADRFGLAQLHQLRGRVGRSSTPSACTLLSRNSGEQAQRRLRAMVENQDGFRLAELDLELRGPGEFLGTRQHGLPLLRAADLVRDQELLVAARAAAQELLRADPELTLPEHTLLRRELRRVYPNLQLFFVA